MKLTDRTKYTKIWTSDIMKIRQLDTIELPPTVRRKVDAVGTYPTKGSTSSKSKPIPTQLQTDAFSLRDRTSTYPTRPSYIPPIHETQEERSMRERRDGLRDLNPSLVKAEQQQKQTQFLGTLGMETKRDMFDASSTKLKQDESIAMRVMMQMDERTLSKLRAAFQLHHDAVDVVRFVEVMLEHLDDHGQDEEELTRMFCELFTQIDIGATDTLTWNDFTSYVVGAASGSADNEAGSQNIDIQTYVPSRTVDQTKHSNAIEQVFYFSDLDRLVVCERGQRSFKLYHPKSLTLDREVFGHRGCVMGAALVTGRHYMATCSNDLTICFWDAKHYKLRQRIPTSTVQMVVHWCEHYERLWSGGVDGSITSWDTDELKAKVHVPASNPNSSIAMRDALLGHSDTVTQLHSIAQQDVLASASLDTTIKLWDLHSGRLRKTLRGHSKGE
jgi:hypothetical protein